MILRASGQGPWEAELKVVLVCVFPIFFSSMLCQTFLGFSSEFQQHSLECLDNFIGISPDICQNIELEHLKKGAQPQLGLPTRRGRRKKEGGQGCVCVYVYIYIYIHIRIVSLSLSLSISLSLYLYLSLCIYVCMYIYIYKYIYISLYICIYIYTRINIYIYIYIYREREREREI